MIKLQIGTSLAQGFKLLPYVLRGGGAENDGHENEGQI